MKRTHDADPTGLLSRADYHHQLAFWTCIAHVDGFLRVTTSEEEVATVVAEDTGEKRSFLRSAVKRLREKPLILPSLIENHLGQSARADIQMKISKIKDGVHFASKEDSLLLQIADACAFGIRRWLNRKTFGTDLYFAMTGNWMQHDFKGYPYGAHFVGKDIRSFTAPKDVSANRS